MPKIIDISYKQMSFSLYGREIQDGNYALLANPLELYISVLADYVKYSEPYTPFGLRCIWLEFEVL
jgi:hypothetical protein